MEFSRQYNMEETLLADDDKLIEEELEVLQEIENEEERRRSKIVKNDIDVVDLFLEEELRYAVGMDININDTSFINPKGTNQSAKMNNSSPINYRKEANDAVIDIIEYDGGDESDTYKISDSLPKARTIQVKPAHFSEEAAIMSLILVGMSVEANYPPQLYKKLFQSYKMSKMLSKMTEEERLLILRMVED